MIAGLTAARKMIATRLKPPRDLSVRTWTLSFLDVIYMELSTARINSASEKKLWTLGTILLNLWNRCCRLKSGLPTLACVDIWSLLFCASLSICVSCLFVYVCLLRHFMYLLISVCVCFFTLSSHYPIPLSLYILGHVPLSWACCMEFKECNIMQCFLYIYLGVAGHHS